MIKWLRRIGFGVVALVVVTVGAGAVYEALARADAANRFPAPGRLVDIGGGRRLQLDVSGGAGLAVPGGQHGRRRVVGRPRQREEE